MLYNRKLMLLNPLLLNATFIGYLWVKVFTGNTD